MGLVVSSPTPTSPFFLISGIIGIVSFAFTLGTFIKVLWGNLTTLTEAPHEVHSYLTNLRQELLEERTSLKFLKKNSKRRQKSAGPRHSRDVEEYLDAALDSATIKTMSDAVRHFIKQFEELEKPFLEPGEEGIHHAVNRRSRRRGDSGSPYYTHEAYKNPSYEKRGRSTADDGDAENFWPQRHLRAIDSRIDTGSNLSIMSPATRRQTAARAAKRMIFPQNRSRFFSLPPELRNAIYELALSTEPSEDGCIALARSQLPSENLSLTCRRAHQESYRMYETACRNYYNDHTFTIDATSTQIRSLGFLSTGYAWPRNMRRFRLDFTGLHLRNKGLFGAPTAVYISVGQDGEWQAEGFLPETTIMYGVEHHSSTFSAHLTEVATLCLRHLESLPSDCDSMVWNSFVRDGLSRKGFGRRGLASLVGHFVRTSGNRKVPNSFAQHIVHGSEATNAPVHSTAHSTSSQATEERRAQSPKTTMATAISAPVLRAHEQRQSPLFRIPSELRNNIYERVFEGWLGPIFLNEIFSKGTSDAPDVPPPSILGSVTPPSDALVRSCRKARKESKPIFDAAFQAYWKNEFVVNVRRHPQNDAYVSLSPNIHIPNNYLGRIQSFTFLVRHRATRVRVACLWLESEGRWRVSAEQDEASPIDDEDEVAHAAVEDVEDSMRRSEAFSATSPTIRTSGAMQARPSTLDRRILHDMLCPLIVEEMFYAAAQERGSHRPWRT
ncbi:hypothetical protein Q7P37_004754 [Cladosporium fusiforme]